MISTSVNKKVSVGVLARIGVLGAIASLLYLWPEIPVIPPIYKLDFSTLPVLLGGFAMGPVSSLFILLIKDLTGLLHSSTMGVGELADFLCSGLFVVSACLVYRRERTRAGALKGMALGIVVMVAAGALANYFIMIPFYMKVMNFSAEAIVGMIANVIPAVDSMGKLILLATAPFNLLKGVVLCLVTLLVYKRLSPLLHGKTRP